MPSLYTWWTRATSVPSWASVLTIDGYRTFEDQLLAGLVVFGAAPSRRAVRTGSVETPKGTIDLGLLVNSWHLLPTHERPMYVRTHLDAAVKQPDPDLQRRLMADWSLAKPHVRVQWIDIERIPDYQGSGPLPDGVRLVADGLVAVLTLELTDTVPFIRPEHTQWTVDTDTVFQRAYANVDRLLETAECTPVPNDGGLELYQLLHTSLSTGCVVRHLNRYLENVHGFLVILPVHQIVMVHPITDPTAASMVEQLRSIGDYVRTVSAGPNTPRVYWVRDQQWTELPAVDSEGRPVSPTDRSGSLRVPDTLQTVLASL